jgi:hypothetical protein
VQWRQTETSKHRNTPEVFSGTIVMRSALGRVKDGQAIGLADPIAHNL